MAKTCAVCAKKSIMGRQYKKLMSKYNPTPKKRKYPNLQWARVPAETEQKRFKGFAGQRILACAKCIKAMAKTK